MSDGRQRFVVPRRIWIVAVGVVGSVLAAVLVTVVGIVACTGGVSVRVFRIVVEFAVGTDVFADVLAGAILSVAVFRVAVVAWAVVVGVVARLAIFSEVAVAGVGDVVVDFRKVITAWILSRVVARTIRFATGLVVSVEWLIAGSVIIGFVAGLSVPTEFVRGVSTGSW